eukprot:8027017-Alexandrium_andersonii.AAC.1
MVMQIQPIKATSGAKAATPRPAAWRQHARQHSIAARSGVGCDATSRCPTLRAANIFYGKACKGSSPQNDGGP